MLDNLFSMILDLLFTVPVFLILFLLHRLNSPNPFRRYLFHPKYSIRKISSRWMDNPVEITLKPNASSEQFRDAIYDCMYSFPDTKSLVFYNLGRLSLNESRFEHFKFNCLDFSHIPSSDFNCLDPFWLPCSRIVLPYDVTTVPLRYCHPDIQCVAIPTKRFVPAREYITYDPEGPPIRVNSRFEILVPDDLIREYQRNPEWASILLEDENGRIFHPSFYPYRA